MSHETFAGAVELPLSAGRHSAADVLRAACQIMKVPVESSRIELDRDLVVSIECERCEIRRRVMRPRQDVEHGDAVCERCGQMARPRIEHQIFAGSDLARERLLDLGIPPYDIVRVVSESAEQLVLLAGDAGTFDT